MEDYDIYNEMNSNDKFILMGVDKDNYLFFQKNIIVNKKIEFMPIRLSYDLDDFSDSYVVDTKKLFIYYYNMDNCFDNELLRIRKHFKHYQRTPNIVFIPYGDEYIKLRKMFQELNIKVVSKEEDIISYIM